MLFFGILFIYLLKFRLFTSRLASRCTTLLGRVLRFYEGVWVDVCSLRLRLWSCCYFEVLLGLSDIMRECVSVAQM